MTPRREAPTPVRFGDEKWRLDELVGALLRERAAASAKRVSVNETVKTAIREAHERRFPQIAADRAAWAVLVGLAGSKLDMLELYGEGIGKQIPEDIAELGRHRVRTPARWSEMSVTRATLGFIPGQGKDVDLASAGLDVVFEVPKDDEWALHFDAFLTDAKGEARIYLGHLDRTVQPYPAHFGRRLHELAAENSLDDGEGDA